MIIKWCKEEKNHEYKALEGDKQELPKRTKEKLKISQKKGIDKNNQRKVARWNRLIYTTINKESSGKTN